MQPQGDNESTIIAIDFDFGEEMQDRYLQADVLIWHCSDFTGLENRDGGINWRYGFDLQLLVIEIEVIRYIAS